MKKLIFIYIYLCPIFLFSQKEDYNWSFGTATPQYNTIVNVLSFNTQPPTTVGYPYPTAEVVFQRNSTCISDSAGNFLFASNGVCVMNKDLDTMQNGGGLNLNGLPSTELNAKSSIILPSATNSNQYYLIYYLISAGNSVPYKLQYALIDMSLNGGLGSVIQKNVPIYTNAIAPWSLHAVRHANGRDWWILCPVYNSNVIHKILFSPLGFQNMGDETVGYLTSGANICSFSTNGSKYIQYLTDDGIARIHNFNRCTGELKGYIDIPTISYTIGISSLAVSPNSQYLYISDGDTLVQYDLTAVDIKASEILIGVSDHFVNNLNMQIFDQMQVAPDGKIYMASGFFDYLHVINNPDSVGVACNFVQRQFQLPVASDGLPNLPNYRLGREVGSACDTVYTSIKEEGIRKEVSIYPNPATNKLYISIVGIKEPLTVLLLNTLGQEVARYALAQEEQEISLANLPKGVYYCRMLGREGVYFASKVIKE